MPHLSLIPQDVREKTVSSQTKCWYSVGSKGILDLPLKPKWSYLGAFL